MASSDTDIKWMDLNEFLNDGYLQEVNRRFFHPLGLALAVSCDKDGKVTDIAGLWDYRDDSEGMLFADGSGDDPAKARTVEDEWVKHAPVRRERFGWVVQPIEGYDKADSTGA